MRQRLGLAAALLGDPELLVLDEPANGLDAAGVHWLRGFLRQFAAHNRTVLISSHILAEVAQTVDQVLIVDHGRLITTVRMDELAGGARSLEDLYLELTAQAGRVSALLRSELLKQRTTRTTVSLLLWMLGLTLLIVLLHVFGAQSLQPTRRRQPAERVGWGTSIGALFAALLGAISITGEIRNGTIRPTLLATPNRTRVIVAKLAASALTGVIVGLIAEALVTGIGSAGLAIRGIPIALSGGDIAQMLAGAAVAAALWAAIGTGLGALVRNQVGAVVGLCVWLLLIESVLIGAVPSAAKFTPGASAGALAGAIQNVSPGGLLAPTLGALLLAAYAAAAATAGLLATERRDIS